jgi:hypothetical protein
MQSIIVKDSITQDGLKSCLDAFFKDNCVSVAYFDLKKAIQKEDVLFEYVFLQGDFKLELCLYTKILFSLEEFALSVCKTFKTQVLISDNSSNPYTWILLNETGKVGIVEQISRDDDLFILKNLKQ